MILYILVCVIFCASQFICSIHALVIVSFNIYVHLNFYLCCKALRIYSFKDKRYINVIIFLEIDKRGRCSLYLLVTPRKRMRGLFTEYKNWWGRLLFYFIDMAIKRGNQASQKRRREGPGTKLLTLHGLINQYLHSGCLCSRQEYLSIIFTTSARI